MVAGQILADTRQTLLLQCYDPGPCAHSGPSQYPGHVVLLLLDLLLPLLSPKDAHTRCALSGLPPKTNGTHTNTLHSTHAMRIGSHVPNDVLFRGHDVRFWKWNGRYSPIVWWLFVLLREQGTSAEGFSLFPVPCSTSSKTAVDEFRVVQ